MNAPAVRFRVWVPGFRVKELLRCPCRCAPSEDLRLKMSVGLGLKRSKGLRLKKSKGVGLQKSKGLRFGGYCDVLAAAAHEVGKRKGSVLR